VCLGITATIVATTKAHLMTYQKKHEVRGTAHEYWIERRRARQQARKRGEGGPYRSQATSQEKKENKKLDPWG
jgi:hypothetical protein